MLVARHVRNTGCVQGVFFRAWTREQAHELGVHGWMRNCADGSVEAHVQGEEESVRQMIERLHGGPPAAEVEEVQLWDVDAREFDGFEIRH